MRPNSLRLLTGATDLAKPFISTRALHGLEHGLRLQIGPASLRKLLDSVDLPAGALETPRAYVPQAHAIAFLGAVAGHVGFSNALFALGNYASVKSYGLFGEFVTEAKTFGAAIGATRDLMAFHVSHDRLCLRHEDNDFRVDYHAALQNIRQYEHYAPLALAVVLSIAEPYFGRRYRRSVTLNLPKPKNTADFEDFFGCDVRFDQPELSVVFDRAAATATRPFQAARVVTLGDVARDAFGAAPRRLVPAVEALVRANIDGATNIDDIARRLDMSERTLRRRLDDSGTHYRELVRRTRVDFARELLTQTDLDVTEISQRVGYSHPSHLGRAFRELTGISPAGLRRAASNKLAGNGYR